MVLIEPAAFDTVDYLLRINVVLLVYDLHYFLLNHQAFTAEIYEVRFRWLVSHAELAGSQLPQSQTMPCVNKDL